MRVEEFDYHLPPELIAQEPAPRREGSRLLVLNRAGGQLRDATFEALPDLLRPGDLLVANESRVLPARLHGRLETGGMVELLLVRARDDRVWEVMAKPGRKLRLGTTVRLEEGAQAVVEAVDGDRPRVRIDGVTDLPAWLARHGRLPTPPYIKQYPDDPERYQTVYARTPGSIAAPTAGLHFSERLLGRLRDRGIETVFVTLHVGPATFTPVRAETVESIRLEGEQGVIRGEVAERISSAESEGRRIVAVGTTTTRLLEGVAARHGMVVASEGPVDLFIRPPFHFRVVDALITNFHLPRSTLLMLVSAFAGRDRILRAYAHAVEQRYRFYSFGDAMLIQ